MLMEEGEKTGLRCWHRYVYKYRNGAELRVEGQTTPGARNVGLNEEVKTRRDAR